jgi:His/Glu/Gln/Arg/opine family amino acid ABC transporter permease subunit
MDRIAANYFNLAVMSDALPKMLHGFGVTVLVSVCVVLFGLALGMTLALLRLMPWRPLHWVIAIYTDVFRTLPQLVIIILLFFALPYANLTLSPFATTVLALGGVLSAFSADIFYAAIMAVPPGQWDAGRALGLRDRLILRKLILPQAVALAVPLLTNRAIAIAKGTALGSAVSLPEMLSTSQSITAIVANPSPLTLAAALYLLLFIPLVVASRLIERRAYAEPRPA